MVILVCMGSSRIDVGFSGGALGLGLLLVRWRTRWRGGGRFLVGVPSRAGQHKGRPHAITPDPLMRPLVRPGWRGDDPGVRVVVLGGSGVRCAPRGFCEMRSSAGDQGSRFQGPTWCAGAQGLERRGGVCR